MQFCHDPFAIEQGLQQSLGSPPATLMVLPNGWVKVVAAIGYVCGDLRRMTLTEVWDGYRAAWRNETVLGAIRRAIAAEAGHADANIWQSIPDEGAVT